MSTGYENTPISGASLAGVSLLAGLSAAERAQIAGRCHGRRYHSGVQIVSHEDSDADVFFIVSGKVRVTYFSASGKEISFRDQEPGQMFGELNAIDQRGRSAYVMALSDALIAVLPRDAFMEVLATHPAVAMATLQHLANLVRLLSDRVIEFSTMAVNNRIHAELLRLAEAAGVADSRAAIDPSPKHADLASRVSTHREAVTRELNRLARSGLLERQAGRLLINDVAALRRMVDEG